MNIDCKYTRHCIDIHNSTKLDHATHSCITNYDTELLSSWLYLL
jgi:hypothetical protein